MARQECERTCRWRINANTSRHCTPMECLTPTQRCTPSHVAPVQDHQLPVRRTTDRIQVPVTQKMVGSPSRSLHNITAMSRTLRFREAMHIRRGLFTTSCTNLYPFGAKTLLTKLALCAQNTATQHSLARKYAGKAALRCAHTVHVHVCRMPSMIHHKIHPTPHSRDVTGWHSPVVFDGCLELGAMFHSHHMCS